MLSRLALSLPVASALTLAAASAQPRVAFHRENMRLQSATVTPGTGSASWSVELVVGDDNGDGSLPDSFRRWWHCEISNLSTQGERLDVTLRNVGYSDVILPVWAASSDGGQTLGAWSRMPLSAVPTVSGGGTIHRFSVTTPLGANAVRLAKWFPYTETMKNELFTSLRANSSGNVAATRSLGTSWQGRPIDLVELTDPNTPSINKKRIWIHSAVHPAENTAYFMVEGLISFLLSGDPLATAVLQNAIVDIVPMANPDGVVLGNYRTNSRSANLESSWAAPYNNAEREIVALRTEIERLMGTAGAPGSNPIELLLNLHSTHNVAFPFHFEHDANPNFDLSSNPAGVVPEVNMLEARWINAFETESPFFALGTTRSSSCGAPSRPFVECMMHDRWSSDLAWRAIGGPRVMAITLEGTYGKGPDTVTWCTPDDYRTAGAQMGEALAQYFAFRPPNRVTTTSSFGGGCNGLLLTATSQHTPPSTNSVILTSLGAPVGSAVTLLLAGQQTFVPLPPPFVGCSILSPFVTAPFVNTPPLNSMRLRVPPIPGLRVDLQLIAGVISGPMPVILASNGIEIQNSL